MANEIERKFLVRNPDIITALQGQRFVQGYLSTSKHATVRVRVADSQAWLTIKGITQGIARQEFEYPIPAADADAMLQSLALPGIIDKTRYRLPAGELCWEIDVFHGDNQGLIIAEIELSHEQQTFDRPDWLGQDVSHDRRYFNSALSQRPFTTW